MRLKEWAAQEGISYWTARRWFHRGLIPNAEQTETGIILVRNPAQQMSDRTIGYARVSSSDQKADLQRQSDRLRIAGVDDVVTEIGSAMNGKRPKLIKLLQTDSNIVVEHRDRLTRFGFEQLEAAVHPRKIIVLDSRELDDDLVRDMTEMLTSFCARLYGKRSARNRAMKAMECASTE